MIGIRLCGVVADLFVLLVTLRYTHFAGYLKTSRPRPAVLQGVHMARLPRVVRNNGVLYFSMLLLINVISLLLGREYQLIASLGNWIGGLMSILTCRFILDPQEANQALSGLTTGGEHGLTHLSFRTPDSCATVGLLMRTPLNPRGTPCALAQQHRLLPVQHESRVEKVR
ncbi:hypothetical protein C8Q78DRAFT_162066 [Trametes maxima]|nr:hypothetical protein C8Q78DRAFT_162066 [Trametes maxima]